MLTIAIITMNRAEQLVEAISSCLSSKLPNNTEFVIVDNASTDNTKEAIELIKTNNSVFKFSYYYSSVNIGVGGGRNKAFEMSNGKYVYFLDDDAIIAPECYDTFFSNSIELMEQNSDIASLSTNIYDIICGNSRNPQGLVLQKKEAVDVFTFRGGSHFLRRDALKRPLYMTIKYGSEELMPSIYIWDQKMRNVYFDDVRIIHKPRINKWTKETKLTELSKLHIAIHYATYRLLYPDIFRPLLRLALVIRCRRHLGDIKNASEECLRMADEIIKSNNVEKVSVKTVIKLWQKFKWTIF